MRLNSSRCITIDAPTRWSNGTRRKGRRGVKIAPRRTSYHIATIQRPMWPLGQYYTTVVAVQSGRARWPRSRSCRLSRENALRTSIRNWYRIDSIQSSYGVGRFVRHRNGEKGKLRDLQFAAGRSSWTKAKRTGEFGPVTVGKIWLCLK